MRTELSRGLKTICGSKFERKSSRGKSKTLSLMIYSLSSYITSLAMTISTYLRGKYSGERWMILVWVWFMDNIQIDLSNITLSDCQD